MSVLEIKDLPIITEIEALSDRAEEVDIKKEGQLCQEIILALKRAIKKNSLLGLSAPQLGYNKRIIVVTQDNQGVSVARNKGVSLAKADYIRFVRRNCFRKSLFKSD